MSAFLSESAVEQAVMSLFGALGYQTAHGPDIGPNGSAAERASFAEVVLFGRLRATLQKINPGLPANAIEGAVGILTRSEGGTLPEENRRFHDFLTNGVAVEYTGHDGRPANGLVKVFEFTDPTKNDWLAVNQFAVAEKQAGKPHADRRPDVVVFVNGLPLAVIELKNPADTQATLKKAYGQLCTYKTEMPDLFTTNELLVVSDGLEAKLGTISSDWERFSPWKSVGGARAADTVPQYEVLIKGVFDRSRLLEIVRGFVVFDDGPHATVKKVAGYHQYDAVRKAVAATVEAVRKPKDHRIGVVWHTQGSGKSLSMVFYAGQLVQHADLKNPTVVMLTDRNDLDGQLFQNFAACRDLIRQDPVQAESADDLRDRLNVSAGGIVFTTIQKFREQTGAVTDRTNVIVVADEAHRSQYGLDTKVDKETGEVTSGFARNLRVALPNAAFIGFTGTPVDTADKVTTNVFGNLLDVYDIRQAVRDGATVPIYYENRLAKLKLNELVKDELDAEFDEITDDEDEGSKQRIARAWAALEALVGAPARVKQIAADIVSHFEKRTAALPGKAMVVAISRRVCVALYKEITKLRPDWGADADDEGQIKVVMTGQASDKPEYQAHIRTKKQLDRIAERFKSPTDPLRLVIVCDMWLTGFDAPCAHTMYLDKPLKAHGLMQAIARVNRVFGAKPSGLVVDYLGLAAELKAALHTYTASGGEGAPTLDQSAAIEFLQEQLEVVRAMFHGFDHRKYLAGAPEERLAGVRLAADFVLKKDPAEGKKRFVNAATELYRGFALAAPADEALAVGDEVAFFQAVRAVFAKSESGVPRRPGDLDSALERLVSKAVVSNGVVDIFQAAGLAKPEVSVLNEEFLAELAGLPHRSLAAELLERLLRNEIRATGQRNLVRSEQFSVLLEEAIHKYQNRSIDAAKVIEEMLSLAREIREASRRGDQLGLTPEEVAFYDALAQGVTSEQVMSEPVLRDLARDLVKAIRGSITIDWTQKDTVKAEMRSKIKRLLRLHKYPPEKVEGAVETVIKQAELLCLELTVS